MNVRISVLAAMRGALSGKTIGRVLFNRVVYAECAGLSGRVLDLAGGSAPSYLPLFPEEIDLVRTDLVASAGVAAVDINAPLPFSDSSFDAVLLFNAIYTAEDPVALAREIRRILKPAGEWLLVAPFVANEMPEPHDYLRFTGEGLERLCRAAGFSSVGIRRMGERASAATQLLHPFFLFNAVRALVYPVALFFDRLVPASVRTAHSAPVGYFVRARK